MFVNGAQANTAATFDEYWHIAEATSIARTGIPPLHYLYPDVKLAYYFWAWIYPSVLVNQPVLDVSVARALSLGSWAQTVCFMAITYYLLSLNTRSKTARLMGLAGISLLSGFDFFVTMGTDNEWWQKAVPWLTSTNQISSFSTLYIWVPQHIAATMAFVMEIIIWRNVRASPMTKAVILGIAGAFILGSSAFVFIGSVFAFAVWCLIYRRALIKPKTILPGLLVFVVFALGAWYQLFLTAGQGGSFTINLFRVPLLEKYTGVNTDTGIAIDKILTIIALPVVNFWVLLIEMGLPFLLYCVWITRAAIRKTFGWDRFAIIYPILMFVAISFLKDKGGGENFVMRSILPALVMIDIIAALSLDNVNWPRLPIPVRIAAVYLAIVITLSQSVTWLFELNQRSSEPLGSVFNIKSTVKLSSMTLMSPVTWPDALQYIHWVNANTPANALIIEETPLESMPTELMQNGRYRMMERIRFMNKVELDKTPREYLFQLDRAISVRQDALNQLLQDDPSQSLIAQTLKSRYVLEGCYPLYYVSWRLGRIDGELVYHDSFVNIYDISQTSYGVQQQCTK